jgi:RNA polymerase sigma factor (sigma-70 family)
MDLRKTCNFRGTGKVTAAVFSDPDQPLVRAAIGGDLHAFEQLVERHRDVVFRVVMRFVGSDHEAEDLTQDTFLRAFHRLERYRGEAPFRTWLLRIAHNTAVTYVTRSGRVATHPLDVGVDEAHVAPGTPAEQLELRERRERLDKKLKGLGRMHRTVLVLRDIEGLSYEEIARITDTPLGSVKGRLHRARAEFIDVLRHNTYDWELPR